MAASAPASAGDRRSRSSYSALLDKHEIGGEGLLEPLRLAFVDLQQPEGGYELLEVPR